MSRPQSTFSPPSSSIGSSLNCNWQSGASVPVSASLRVLASWSPASFRSALLNRKGGRRCTSPSDVGCCDAMELCDARAEDPECCLRDCKCRVYSMRHAESGCDSWREVYQNINAHLSPDESQSASARPLNYSSHGRLGLTKPRPRELVHHMHSSRHPDLSECLARRKDLLMIQSKHHFDVLSAVSTEHQQSHG